MIKRINLYLHIFHYSSRLSRQSSPANTYGMGQADYVTYLYHNVDTFIALRLSQQ